MNTQEANTFDPYHRWLGIPPKHCPPNHYRLLGIDAFEDDVDVIESAADRQMAHVRSFQTGQHAKLTQQILNELSTAKICLLNSEKKAAYDKQLRTLLASESATSTARPNPAQPVVTAPQTVEPQLQLPTPIQQPYQPIASAPGLLSQSPVVAVKPMQRPSTRVEELPFWARPQVYLPVAAATVAFVVIVAALLLFRPTTKPNDVARQSTEASVASPANGDNRTIESPQNDAAIAQPLDVPSQVTNPKPRLTGIGADVEVVRMKMVPFANPQKLPDSPTTAYGFEWIARPMSAEIKNGVLQFSVKSDGLVYLVTDTQYQGNRSGGWWEEKVTKQELVQQGWEDLGACPWNQKEAMLKRFVKNGESYRIRTNKYGPPKLIVPGPIVGRSTASSSPGPNTKSLIGQHILRLGEKGGIELANTKRMFRHDREWTIEMWARLDPNAKALVLVGDRVVGGHREIVDPDGGFMVRCQKNGGNYFAEVPFVSGSGIRKFTVKPNEWQHFAVTSDTKHLRFFVDGTLVTERAADPDDWKLAPLNLHIGFHRYLFWSVAHGFNGDLRAVRISSTCNYREPFTPPGELTKAKNTDVLLSFWNPKGDRIEDLSGNGYYGTITRGQWIPLSE